MKKLILFLVSMFALGTDNMSGTILTEARAMIPDLLGPQLDFSRKRSDLIPALLGMANESQAKVASDYQVGRTIKVSMLLGEDITCNTARTCAPTGTQPSSTTVTLSPFTATARFTIAKSQLNANDFELAQVLARTLFDAERSIFFANTNSVDAKIAAAIAANVSSTNSGDGSDATLTGSIMEVDDTNKVALYSLLDSHMALNNLSGPFTLVSNTHWKHTFGLAAKYVAATNLVDAPAAYGIKQFFSNSLAVGTSSGYDSNHYIMRDGAMGLVMLTDKLYTNFDPGKFVYERFVVDSAFYPGVSLMVKRYDVCKDTSSDGGQVDDDTINFEVAVIGAVYAVPSTTKKIYNYVTKPVSIS